MKSRNTPGNKLPRAWPAYKKEAAVLAPAGHDTIRAELHDARCSHESGNSARQKVSRYGYFRLVLGQLTGSFRGSVWQFSDGER